MKKIMIAVAMTAMIVFPVFGATWEKTYPELGNSGVTSVCQTQDGGYTFTGITWLEHGVGDLYVAKVDSLGNHLRFKIYHREDQTEGIAIRETPDGGLAVLGSDFSGPAGQWNCSFWLLRINTQLDSLWTRNYGTSKSIPIDMDITLDTGFIMTGRIDPGDSEDDHDILLIRADKNGNLLWEKNLGGGAGGQIRTREDGGFDLLAVDHDELHRSYPWFLRLDSQGDTLWTEHYFSPAEDYSLYSFSPANDGYIMTGTEGPGCDRLLVVKTDEEAKIRWEKMYQTSYYLAHAGTAIWQTNDGNYIVVADIAGDPDRRAIWILKLNDIGDTLRTKIFTGPTGACMVECAEKTSDGGAVIGGCAPDAYLIKTDESGWVGVEVEEEDNNDIGVFPNPSGGCIYFQTDSPNAIELRIYDISGRLVKETQIERSLKMNLLNGVYFWKAGEQKGKFIVVK